MNQSVSIRNVEELAEILHKLKPDPGVHLGEILLEEREVSDPELEAALLQQQSEPGKHLGKILVEMEVVDQVTINHALAKKFGIPVIKLSDFKVDPDILTLVPPDIALEYNVLPLAEIDGAVILAMENPLDWEARDVIQFHVGHNVDAVIASAHDIGQTLNRYYSDFEEGVKLEDLQLNPVIEAKAPPPANMLEKQGMQKPIVRLLNALLLQAVVRGASDINIRPEKERINVYYRVDGKLQFVRSLHSSLLSPLVSRIKVTAQMNVAEHHMPQDGHARLRKGKREVDLRISVIPTIMGESVVIRILDKEVGLKPLDDIGFNEKELGLLHKMINRSFGMFLVTGPTGCGKSTTLYGVLNEIKKSGPHIITVEDPVEYDMHGVEQIQILPIRGYTFAEALRHILRHDPDVIMIGEIRDLETARIANKAALTGHIVLSTLHTNDAASAITRLIDMGVEPYLLSATLLGTMAQRLVRLNCEHCKIEDEVDPEIRRDLGVGEQEKFYRGEGCLSCDFTGYHGRLAICELLPITNSMKKLITGGRDALELKEAAVKEGMTTLTQNAIKLAREGRTSLEEVYAIRLD